MPTVKYLFFGILSLNAFAVLFTGFSYYKFFHIADLASYLTTSPKENTFTDPTLAFFILQELDVNEPMIVPQSSESEYEQPYLGLKINDQYCVDHRATFVRDPEIIFGRPNFLTSFLPHQTARKKVIKKLGTDLMPDFNRNMPEEEQMQFKFDIPAETTLFFMSGMMYDYRKIGLHYSCLTQASNHIPGHDIIYRKDYVAGALLNYITKYKKRPQCFSNQRFFPKTWILQDKEQCLEFFSELNSTKYQDLKKERGIVYFRKIGAFVHKGEGVFPVTDEEEKNITQTYDGGRLCGIIEDNNLIQYSVHNPLLIEGKKFDFRVFMLVASTNPLIAYYHDGYLRISLSNYDTHSTNLGTFLTNTALSKPLFKKAHEEGTFEGMTEKEMKEKSCWFYDHLAQYLQEIGRIEDPQWVENHLRTKLKKAMVHLIRMSQRALLKRSSLFELYGLDFMMDENLDLWFIEANAKPLTQGWTKETKKYLDKLVRDHFEIALGLLRSRTKRIIGYVNGLIAHSDGKWKVGSEGLMMDDLEMRREEFRQVIMNRFEPEFKPGKSNGFQKIIDENLKGSKRYMGLIDKECL